MTTTTQQTRNDARELMKTILSLHFQATNRCKTMVQRAELALDCHYGIDEMRGLLNKLEAEVTEATRS